MQACSSDGLAINSDAKKTVVRTWTEAGVGAEMDE
jgi:hypothetical protein